MSLHFDANITRVCFSRRLISLKRPTPTVTIFFLHSFSFFLSFSFWHFYRFVASFGFWPSFQVDMRRAITTIRILRFAFFFFLLHFLFREGEDFGLFETLFSLYCCCCCCFSWKSLRENQTRKNSAPGGVTRAVVAVR